MDTIKYANTIKKSIQNIYTGLLTTVVALTATCSRAQINPYQAIYFQNRYLVNPSMASLEKGLNINLAVQQQWSSFSGAISKSQSLTTEYQATDKVGLGLNINDDQSGIFRQTRVMGTYAYHVPLSDKNQKLNFGLSCGINDSRINYDSVNGDLSDVELLQYNQRKPFVDGVLGLAYSSNDLFIQGVLQNLNPNVYNRANQQNEVDHTVFFTAISYKIKLSNATNAFSLEPLAAYRDIKGFNNIFDLGVNFKMNDYHLDFQTIYHSNDNFAFGVVYAQQTYGISFDYNVYAGPIYSYTNGAFEVGLKLNLFNK